MPKLSNETLAHTMEILEALPPEGVDTFVLQRSFWERMLFKWGFPPWLIDHVIGAHWNWSKIIRDLFAGAVKERQSGGVSYPIPPQLQEDMLTKLTALALSEAPNTLDLRPLRQSLRQDGMPDYKSVRTENELRQGEGKMAEKSEPSKNTIFVIHGRDERLRRGVFDFLRSLKLDPLEWSDAVKLTGKSTPYVGEVLDAAFSHAQAVVVIFSPDDLAHLRPDLCGPMEPLHEKPPSYQARPNVLFEAGMAMARQPNRTVLVEIGSLRPFSDIGGRHTIRMDNSVKKRQELAQRLQDAGCPAKLTGTDWHDAGDMKPPELQTHTKSPPNESIPPLKPPVNVANAKEEANKILVKHIMRGTDRLLAYEIVRDGFPKVYLVEFTMRNKEPKSCSSEDYKVANVQWHEWYKEWKQQPGGFGGSSGTGLDGIPPW
jgi:predicted nucleotide-binding protein